MYVISYKSEESWWYIGFRSLDDDPNDVQIVFYEGLNDHICFFNSIKQAIDFWEENKGAFINASMPELAIRKLVYKTKKKLEVLTDGVKNC